MVIQIQERAKFHLGLKALEEPAEDTKLEALHNKYQEQFWHCRQ